MLKHAFNSPKASADDPTLVDGPKWNAEHIADTDGLRMESATVNPTPPAAGFMKLFARAVAGGALPAYIGPSGLDSILQPNLGRNKILYLAAYGNSTAFSAIGTATNPQATTLTQRNVETTNYFRSIRRVGSVSGTGAGNSCGVRTVTRQWWRGTGPGLGGFRAFFRFGCADAAAVAGARTFVGFVNFTTQITNVNPSTLTSMVGVGSDSGDANLSIMHNDGSGAATKIDLGANFPDHTLSEDMYELALFCPPNGTAIGWQVTRLNTGATAMGVIETDMPAANELITPQFWRNNGPTALAVGQDFSSLYIETDS